MRLRRRDRGAHRRRAVRAPRRAGASASARSTRPGRLLPRPRRSDPAAVGRRAQSHPRNRALLTKEGTAEIAKTAEFRVLLSSKTFLRALCGLGGSFFVVIAVAALAPEVLRSTGAVPAHVAGQFREPVGFQQSASGQYFVFDRRAPHRLRARRAAVERVDDRARSAASRAGSSIPTAFAVEPNGTFVVADAPNNRERIQIFTPAGFRIGGFTAAGPTEGARRARERGAQRHRIAAVHRHVDPDVAAGDRRADQRVRAERRRAPDDRTAAARPATKTIRSCTSR